MELSYRRTALAGATSIGLVIALYDTLSGNLRRAAQAITDNNIQQRCAEVNHALLVLAQLENMIVPSSEDELAGSLSLFYSYLRSKMMEASVQKSAELLHAQIALVLQIRTAWQQRDAVASQEVPAQLWSAEAGVHVERASFSQSM